MFTKTETSKKYIFNKQNLRNIVLYIYPKKVLSTAATQKHQSVFFCEAILFFQISEKFFYYSTCLCFSYSKIFLYRSRFYYFFFFFFFFRKTSMSCTSILMFLAFFFFKKILTFF